MVLEIELILSPKKDKIRKRPQKEGVLGGTIMTMKFEYGKMREEGKWEGARTSTAQHITP